MKIRKTSLLIVAIFVFAIGIAAGFIILPKSPPHPIMSLTTESSYPITSKSFNDSRKISGLINTSETKKLIIRANGTLINSKCSPGEKITSGNVPFVINQTPVLALATTHPLWRDLSIGDSGDDVASLQTELQRLGKQVELNSKVDKKTLEAFKETLKANGYAVDPKIQTISIAQILWLPEQEFTIGECESQIGEEVQALQTIVNSSSKIQSLTLKIPQDATSGPRIIEFNGVQTAATETGTITDENFLAAIDQTLILQEQIDKPQEISVEYKLIEPIEAYTVTPAAIFGIQNDKACIKLSKNTKHEIKILDSRLGMTIFEYLDPKPTDVAPEALDPESENSCLK